MTKATANASIEQLINTNELELQVQGWVNQATHRDTTASTTPDTHGVEDIHKV